MKLPLTREHPVFRICQPSADEERTSERESQHNKRIGSVVSGIEYPSKELLVLVNRNTAVCKQARIHNTCLKQSEMVHVKKVILATDAERMADVPGQWR